jgi:uncharacterized protein (UPF0335 family)
MTADLMGNKSSDELAGIIERIETLESERKQASEKIKAEYDAAAGAGFDKKAIKALVKERRSDAVKTIELRAVINAYRAALARKMGNALGELGEWARSWGAMENKMGVHVAVDEYKGWSNDLDKVFGKGKPPSGKDAASGEGASP